MRNLSVGQGFEGAADDIIAHRGGLGQDGCVRMPGAAATDVQCASGWGRLCSPAGPVFGGRQLGCAAVDKVCEQFR